MMYYAKTQIIALGQSPANKFKNKNTEKLHLLFGLF
jgi:hypothetical protein